jgi:hypothetical protein
MLYEYLSKGGCADFTETIVLANDPDEPWCVDPISHLTFYNGDEVREPMIIGNADLLC